MLCDFDFSQEKKSTWSTLNTKLRDSLLFTRPKAYLFVARPSIIKDVPNDLASELENGGKKPVWFKAMCNLVHEQLLISHKWERLCICSSS